MPDISKSKDNQTMKFGQLIEHNLSKILFKNNAENEVKIVSPDVFIKSLDEVNASTQHLSFNAFWLSLTWSHNKNKLTRFHYLIAFTS